MRSIFSVLIIIIGFMGSVLLHRVKKADERRNYEFSDFLVNAHISLHWVGSDGTIIWANQYEMDNLGYTRDDYIGHHISEFHRDNAVIEDILNRLTRNETLNNYEAVLKHKNGSFRNVLINSSALFRNDDFIYTRCITTDITERRKVDDARRESDLRYQQIVENATDIIYRTDIEGNISYLNHVALRISGYTHEEALGKHFTEGVVPAYRKEIMYFYKRQIRKQIQDSYYEFPLLTKGGTEIWLGQNVQLIWKGKQIEGFQAVARNINEKRQAEIALTARVEQQAAVAALGQHALAGGRPSMLLDEGPCSKLPIYWGLNIAKC